MLNKILYVTIALLTVILLAVTFFIFAPHLSVLFTQNDQITQEEYESLLARDIAAANALLNQGDILAAIDIYDRLLLEVRDDSFKYGLIFHKANALFLLGQLNTTKEAIDILGQALLEDSAEPTFKGWALVTLYRYHYQTQSPEVLNHIRSLPVFSDLRGINDKEFLAEIVRRSDILHPTMFGKILLALPLVEELENMSGASAADVSIKADEIELLAEQSRNLQLAETWMTDPYSQMLVAYYRALILAAATAGGTDPTLARVDFESALSFAPAYPESKSIRALTPIVRLHLASLYLNHADLDPNGEMFNAQVGYFIDSVDDMNRFDLLLSNATADHASRGYRLFSDIAAESETFRNFIQQNYSVAF